MTGVFRFAFAFCLVLCLAGPALSQNRNTGEIRGTVTDASGAVLPGATVTVANIDTGVTKIFVTNGDGIYDTVSTPPGRYNITFSTKGFKTLVRGPITLEVTVITENATLEIGAVSEEVRVTAVGAPLLETETGQQGSIMDFKSMSELPQSGGGITGADWAAFNIYLPGAEGTTQGRTSQAGGAWNAGDAASINGNLPNFDNFLQDGASTILPASYNNDDEIFETISEVQVNTSSFSAQYGMGGVVFNQISKSGTNGWHGSAYEFFSNNFLNANNYFNNQAAPLETNPLNPSGPEIANPAHEVPYLRYDQFGGSVGGPIIKNKFFFFFDIDRIVNNSASNGYVTVPTAAEEQGDFTGMYPVYDPLTTTGSGATLARASFASECGGANMIPNGTNCGGIPSRINPVSAAIMASKYGWPTAPQGVGTCSTNPLYPNECTNNLYLAHINPAPVHRYFGRLDYNLSDKNRLMYSISQKDNPGVDNGLFNCPLDCGSGDVDGYNTQITDAWTVSPTLVNEFRFGYTKQGNWFLSSSIGLNPATAFGLQDTHYNQFPIIGCTNPYCGFGGPDAVNTLNPATDAVYVENSFDPADVVTLIHGKHVLHFGIEVLMSEGNTTAWGANSAGNYGFSGQYTAGVNANGTLNTGTAGSGFGDFLLGNFDAWAAENQFLTGMRMKSPQAFIQDDWKLKPNLTLNLGLRWTGNTGMSEEHNRLGDFDQNLINPFGPFAGTAGSLWFAGQDNRTTLQHPVWDIFLPRVGVAWSVKDNTVVRGGAGLFAYNYSMDLYGGEGGGQMGFGAAFQGSSSDPDSAAGDTGWISAGNTTPLLLSSSATMMANALPYIEASRNPASYISLNPVYSPPYEPYDIGPGEIWEWTLAVDHQFANDFAASVAYVGSHAMHLQYITDLNQITNPALLNANDVSACNGATPASIALDPSTCERPYPAFGSLSGSNFNGISNYDSLQILVQKRYSYGLTFNVNYAWSHMLDDQDSAGWGSTSGAQVWQIGNDPAANYGNSNFDTPQALKGTATYELPFGIGKPYMNQNAILDAALGGWRVAGTFIYQSGNPFTVLDNGVSDYSQAGNVFANPVKGVSAMSGTCPNGATVGTISITAPYTSCWFNAAAFETPTQQGNGSFGTGGRNTLFGPKLSDINLSLAKTWHYKERLGLTLRGDFVNALNHPSFTLPNTDVSSSGVGTVKGVANGPRTIQLGARLAF
ncbi:MAG TPA: TonB-dependent receptor [Candidatus Cybelea sp.]|nr:TonB-dependent receptor [Candidatus Cybelea sp.]